MKLSEALEHQDKIKRLTAELNTAINSAVKTGLIVEAECVEFTCIGYSPSVAIQTSVKVNPQDID
jgi:hypothetical protein